MHERCEHCGQPMRAPWLRRLFQFRLRNVLLVMVLVAMGICWWRDNGNLERLRFDVQQLLDVEQDRSALEAEHSHAKREDARKDDIMNRKLRGVPKTSAAAREIQDRFDSEILSRQRRDARFEKELTDRRREESRLRQRIRDRLGEQSRSKPNKGAKTVMEHPNRGG